MTGECFERCHGKGKFERRAQLREENSNTAASVLRRFFWAASAGGDVRVQKKLLAKKNAHEFAIGRRPILTEGASTTDAVLSTKPRAPTMDPKSRRPRRQDNALSLLNAIIEVTNLTKELSSPTPAKAIFGSVSILLKMIRVRFSSSTMIYTGLTYDQDSIVNKSDYVELGLTCANVCKALHRGMGGKELDDLSQPVREAVEQLTTCVSR